MDDFLANVEGLELGDRVELYELDLNPAGVSQIIRWTPSRQDGLSLWWRTHEYLSYPIHVQGFRKSSQEKPPEPVLSVSNIQQGGFALLTQYGELLGAKLTRWVTFLKFLDKDLEGNDNPFANGNANFLPEIWYVEQPGPADPTLVQWRLKSALDIRDEQLPNRRAYKEFCWRVYRSWNVDEGEFEYAPVKACPYAGASYFKTDGTATLLPEEDECSYDMGGCALRFPGQPLPIWAFPGLQRFG